MEKSVVMVAGEDLESSEEEFDRSESLSLASKKSSGGSAKNDIVLVEGEAPESDIDGNGNFKGKIIIRKGDVM
jgi:hypothetical protein